MSCTNVPKIGHKNGTILPAKTEIPFPLPLPPQVVLWKTTRVNKNRHATSPKSQSRENWVN